MSRTIRIALLLTFCFAFAAVASAQTRNNHPAGVSIGGVYEKFDVGAGSGDLEGMRVSIFAAGEAWHAIVQIAGGGAGDPAPVLVDVTVNKMHVEFTVEGTKYEGTVSAAGLKIKGGDMLKRKNPASFFSSMP